MFVFFFVLYIDVLRVSMGFGVIVCIYEDIPNWGFVTFFENPFSRNDGDAKPGVFILEFLRRP